MAPKPFAYTLVLHGHGKVSFAGDSFACADTTCTKTVEVDPALVPLQIAVLPDAPDWVPATSTVDGDPARTGHSWGTFLVDGEGDHTIDVAFVEMKGCSPTASFAQPPTFYILPELCAGHVATIEGMNLANHPAMFPNTDTGACTSLRGMITPGTYDDPATLTTLSLSASSTYADMLVLNVPKGFPPGSAWLADRTLQGLAYGPTQVVSSLPTPVLDSVTPSIAHPGDTITLTGSSLDHVARIRFVCDVGCDLPDGSILDGFYAYVSAKSPTTIEYKLSSADPTAGFTVGVSNACADSNGLPITIQ
jgi:hypothetical protein